MKKYEACRAFYRFSATSLINLEIHEHDVMSYLSHGIKITLTPNSRCETDDNN